MPENFWLALGAVATVLLAITTAYLGWQTRDVSRRTGELAKTTTTELDQLKRQTDAMEAEAAASHAQLKELREQRQASMMPVVTWNFVGVEPAQSMGELPRLRVRLRVENHGPTVWVYRCKPAPEDSALALFPPIDVSRAMGVGGNVEILAYILDPEQNNKPHSMRVALEVQALIHAAPKVLLEIGVTVARVKDGISVKLEPII